MPPVFVSVAEWSEFRPSFCFALTLAPERTKSSTREVFFPLAARRKAVLPVSILASMWAPLSINNCTTSTCVSSTLWWSVTHPNRSRFARVSCSRSCEYSTSFCPYFLPQIGGWNDFGNCRSLFQERLLKNFSKRSRLPPSAAQWSPNTSFDVRQGTLLGYLAARNDCSQQLALVGTTWRFT